MEQISRNSLARTKIIAAAAIAGRLLYLGIERRLVGGVQLVKYRQMKAMLSVREERSQVAHNVVLSLSLASLLR